MGKQVIADYSGAKKIIQSWLANQQRQFSMPVLDEQGRPTGETYDTRIGRAGQPDPNRFRAHLDYLSKKYGGYEPQAGQEIPEFNPVDPYESSGIGESLSNILASAYTQSITGELEKGLGKLGIGDEEPDAFGLIDQNSLEAWRPNTAEQIGSGIASFFMPADLAIMAASGGVGGAVAKGAQLGRVGANIAKTALQLGSYEGARGFFEGIYDPNKSTLEEMAVGFGKGAFLGATLGGVGEVAGKLIPKTLRGASVINKANAVGAEVFTLGTVSPLLEGEAPGFDDYVNAAGFIVGIKTLGALGGLPKKAFERKQLAELIRMKKEVDAGRPIEEVIPEMVEKAIEENPGLNHKFVRRAKAAEDGAEVGKLGDFIIGDKTRKLFTPEALETPVKVSSKPPEKAGEVGAENVAGWVGWDADGVYKIFIHPQHRASAGFTILHEAAHVLRKNKGRAIGGDKAEQTADEMAKYVAEAKDLTPEQRGKLAQKQWEKPFQNKAAATIRAERVEGPAARQAIGEIIPDQKQKPKAFVFITEPAKKSAQFAKKLFGRNRQGVTVGVYETTPGKESWTVLDVSAPSTEARVELVKKAAEKARLEGVTLYISDKLTKTQAFADLQKAGLVSEKPVGRYYQIKTEAKAEVKAEPVVAPEAKVAEEPATVGVAEREPGVVEGTAPGVTGFTIPKKPEIPVGKPEVPVEPDRAVADVTEQRLRDKRAELRELYRQSGRQVSEDYIQGLSVGQMDYILTGGREGVKPTADAFRKIADKTVEEATAFSEEAGKKVRAFTDRITPAFGKQLKNRFKTEEGQELVRDNGPLSIDSVYKIMHRGVGSTLEKMRQGGFVIRSKVEQFVTGKGSLTEEQRKDIAAAIDPLKEERGKVIDPEVREVARNISKIMDERHAYYQKIWQAAGLKLGYVKGYFPRTIQQEIREAMYADMRKAKELLADATDKSDRSVRAVLVGKDRLAEAVEHILKSKQSKDLYSALKVLDRHLVYEMGAGDMFSTARFEKPRRLDLPSKFYERDAGKVLPEYLMAMEKRAAELQVWGNHGEKALKLLEGIRNQDPEEYRTAMKMMRIFTGVEQAEHGYTGKSKKFVDAFVAAEFATKIGLGRATLLNLSQPIISFGQEMGIWNTVRAGFDLFNPNVRSFLRESGAVDRYLLEAVTGGERPGGIMGKFAEKMGTVSGFSGVNKALQYWSGATFWRAAKSWHAAAQGDSAHARWARERLSDFNLDYTKPLAIQQNTMLESIYRFATDSQLQANILRDPLMMNDPRLRPLFVFKRFGYRQMSYLKDTMKRELMRGNVMPLLRLGAAGMVGGEATIWTINKIKSMLSGEPAYRQEDEWQDRALNNLAFIGSLGMMSDMIEIDRVSKIPKSVRFALEPVGVADVNTFIDTSTRFLEDWEKYGDGWLATRRNANGIFGFLGSYPRQLSRRLQTDAQKVNRADTAKGVERRAIFESLLSGDWQAASRRVQNWNGAYPDDPLTLNDVGPSAMRKWVRQQAKLYAKAQGGDKAEMRANEKARRDELLDEMNKRDAALDRYRERI